METTGDTAPWTGGAGGAGTMAEDGRARAALVRRERHAMRTTNGHARGDGEMLSSALAWFSVGLGLAQLAAPDALARLIGVRDDDRTRTTMRMLGARELTSGIGILAQPRSSGWMWVRVAGDAMDLALLREALESRSTDRNRTTAAIAAVLGVAALDVVAARRRAGANGDGAALGLRGVTEQERRAERGTRIRHSVTVSRPREEVYRFWRDLENLPRFMRHLERVTVLDERRSRWHVRAPAGRTVEWEAEIVEDVPNERIAWRSLPGAGASNTGEVRFTTAPGDRGTEVHVDLHYDPPGGALGKGIAKLFREDPGQQIRDDLSAFKQVLEVGEVVVSDASLRRGPHPARPSRVHEHAREG